MAGFLLFETDSLLMVQKKKKLQNFIAYVDILVNSVMEV